MCSDEVKRRRARGLGTHNEVAQQRQSATTPPLRRLASLRRSGARTAAPDPQENLRDEEPRVKRLSGTSLLPEGNSPEMPGKWETGGRRGGTARFRSLRTNLRNEGPQIRKIQDFPSMSRKFTRRK